jgi:putative GTP pyrophosphokinase
MIQSFAQEHLDAATERYAEVERRIHDGDPSQAVLVSAGSIETLKRAYPNYFLDTREFIRQLGRLESG